MSIRLGQILLNRGQISEAQVAQALEIQVSSGCRFGTTIVQLEATSLDEIGAALSVQHGVPHAQQAMLDAVSAETLAVLPAEVCDELKVFPLRVEGRVLHLAMRDPLRSIAGQLAFSLKATVQPYVVPELRLGYYLELRYGIPRDPRLTRVPGGGQHQPERRTYLAPSVEPDSVELREEDAGLIYLDQYQTASSLTAVPPRPIDALLDKLAAATSGPVLTKLLVEPALAEPSTSLLFRVRESYAIACAASGSRLPEREVVRLVVSLQSTSLLQVAFQVAGGVKAQAANDPLHCKIAAYLGWPQPQEVCVVPVLIHERVVNLLCVQSETPFAEVAMRDLSRLTTAAGEAYLRLVRAQISQVS